MLMERQSTYNGNLHDSVVDNQAVRCTNSVFMLALKSRCELKDTSVTQATDIANFRTVVSVVEAIENRNFMKVGLL